MLGNLLLFVRMVPYKIWGYVGAIGAGIIWVLAYGSDKKRKGRKEEAQRQKEADNEKAAAIRDSVRNVKRVSRDNRKFRD